MNSTLRHGRSTMRKFAGRSALVLALVCSASATAFAQNCSFNNGTINNINVLAGPAGSAGAALAGAIGNMNTAFLSQQGSAFVSAPANPAPDQPGGGVWARAIGGEVNLQSTSTSTAISTGAGVTPAGTNVSTSNCSNSVHQNYAGVQVGADIARLNWNGWNVHLGTTVGYLGANSTDNNGFSNGYEIPFIGTYVVATKGRFFADLMVREEFYNTSLLNTGFVGGTPSGNNSFFNQPVGAHGYSISTSAGYNADMGQGWFIEPSAGFIYSNTSVDSFTTPGTTNLPITGTVSTNNIISEIGRASLRVGRTIETPNIIWQPFASASVFHEFAGSVVTNFVNTPNGEFVGGLPATTSQQTLTSRVGTYGQYSVGVAGQVVNTGWLGFLRLDYRYGDNINGFSGNAGVRYQFTPEMIASVMPTKAVKAPTSFIAPTNWTGFYVGGFGGVAGGRTQMGFAGEPVDGAKPFVFGALGGGEIGYNRQINNWVFGLEGDVGAANVKGARTAGLSGGLDNNGESVTFSPAYFTLQDKTNWMATAAARVGYAYGRTLYYVKGGAAFEDSTSSAGCIFGPTGQIFQVGGGDPRSCINQAGLVTPGFSTATYTRVGWTLGFGTEFDLGHNWSAKTEYDYIAFGSHSALASDGTTILTDKANISQVKVGLNYKFGPTAVVAKY